MVAVVGVAAWKYGGCADPVMWLARLRKEQMWYF
jgi:hypothetical protein